MNAGDEFPTKSPWGRPLSEAEVEQPRATFGGRFVERQRVRRLQEAAVRQPVAADFVEAGLSEADAALAVEGLKEGRFLSFEDACFSAVVFGTTKALRLDEAALREKARQFVRVGS